MLFFSLSRSMRKVRGFFFPSSRPHQRQRKRFYRFLSFSPLTQFKQSILHRAIPLLEGLRCARGPDPAPATVPTAGARTLASAALPPPPPREEEGEEGFVLATCPATHSASAQASADACEGATRKQPAGGAVELEFEEPEFGEDAKRRWSPAPAGAGRDASAAGVAERISASGIRIGRRWWWFWWWWWCWCCCCEYELPLPRCWLSPPTLSSSFSSLHPRGGAGASAGAGPALARSASASITHHRATNRSRAEGKIEPDVPTEVTLPGRKTASCCCWFWFEDGEEELPRGSGSGTNSHPARSLGSGRKGCTSASERAYTGAVGASAAASATHCAASARASARACCCCCDGFDDGLDADDDGVEGTGEEALFELGLTAGGADA